MLKVFGGALLIVVTARLIGMEYSGGTIRVLLSRGVGRLQLSLGKLTAVTLVALALSVAGAAYSFLLEVILLAVKVRQTRYPDESARRRSGRIAGCSISPS